MSVRRCCEPGCQATQKGGAYGGCGWYRVGRGCMAHACPTHAMKWRAIDLEDRARDQRRGDWRLMVDEWIDELLEHIEPYSDHPMQASTSWEQAP